MASIPFYIVDVFAEAKFKGNQLAVFLNAEHLTSEQMQTFTKEINFAESTFILRNEMQNGGFDVRIFTPEFEVPFAGHPTLGTVFIIKEKILKQNVPHIKLNLKVGQIPVDLHYEQEQLQDLWMTQVNPLFGRYYQAEEIAPILGLSIHDLHREFPIQEVSTGIPFCIVPIEDLDAIKRIQINQEKYRAFIQKYNPTLGNNAIDHDAWLTAFHCFTPETYHPENQINVRMFDEYYGVTEDAATGSANGCLLAYLLKHQFFGKTVLDLRVEQGYEIRRPSLLKIKGEILSSSNMLIQVGGQVHLVASGEWIVD